MFLTTAASAAVTRHEAGVEGREVGQHSGQLVLRHEDGRAEVELARFLPEPTPRHRRDARLAEELQAVEHVRGLRGM